MLTQRELNLRQWIWFNLLNNYDMGVHYNLGKANIVADAFSRTSMGSTTHVNDWKKELLKYVHLLDSLWWLLLVGVFQFIPVVNHPWWLKSRRYAS